MDFAPPGGKSHAKYRMGRITIGTKWKAKPVTIDGMRFASQREARRYGELKALEHINEISGLVVQPVYPLHVMGATGNVTKIGVYRGDFGYVHGGIVVVEDVKAPPSRTPIYKWKIKHLRAEYGITVTEIE